MVRFNENNEVITDESYSAILVGLELEQDISESMEELKGLAEAAGAETLGIMIQRMERPNKASLIGSGKVDELKDMVQAMEADTVIFNDELTGMQMRNLEDTLGVRVIDRTILILDIFAARANSREGKLQVELAQLKYRLPRLTGFGKSLSRLGGGIGTRGPGEKKLETDRRHIERRIYEIQDELEDIKSNRSVQRSRREKNEIPVVALVGYTNAGKSALMNRLLKNTGSNGDTSAGEKAVFEKDMLFATLDTAQRKVVLDSNHQFILIDTVGFVSKLPHTLVSAFKATLEEVCCADLLVQVVDASGDFCDFNIKVTEKVLEEIGAGGKPMLTAYNKIDLMDWADRELLPGGDPDTVCISAAKNIGIDELLEKIKEKLFAGNVRVRLLVPYTKGDVSSYICEKTMVKSMEYREDGTYFDVELSPADFGRLEAYTVEEQ